MKTRGLIFFVFFVALPLWSDLCAADLLAWGDNTYGQTNVPPGLTNVVAISSGSDYHLALTEDGEVTAWGNNQYGACNVPPGLGGVVAVSSFDEVNLALKADGSVIEWGGSGTLTNKSLGSVVAVAQGLWVSLALKADGTVTVLGQPNPSFPETIVPSNLSNVVAISAGIYECLALRSDGTVTAWGQNSNGEGNVPADLTNAIAIFSGGTQSFALRADGTVVAWGANYQGECNVPADLTNAVAIGPSMAIKADGTVVTWGPATVPLGLASVTAISASVTGRSTGLALANSQKSPAAISFISPLTTTVGAGGGAFFSVGATGSGPLSYQWLFGTNVIQAATNRWLALSNVDPSQSGSYAVVVSNAESSVTSQSVTLEVVPSLDISLAPAIKLKGSPGSTFSIQYTSDPGATNAWIALATVTLTNSQQYYVDLSAIGQPARLYRLLQIP